MKKKAYRYRIYPDPLQKELLAKTFGCVRFIYNKMLSDKIDHYVLTKKSLANTPAQYKDEYPFLKEVDSLALANAQLNLQTAYKNFFTKKSIGFPHFKSKKNEASYTTNRVNGNIAVISSTIKLPKVGYLKAKLHRQLPEDALIKSVTFLERSPVQQIIRNSAERLPDSMRKSPVSALISCISKVPRQPSSTMRYVWKISICAA